MGLVSLFRFFEGKTNNRGEGSLTLSLVVLVVSVVDVAVGEEELSPTVHQTLRSKSGRVRTRNRNSKIYDNSLTSTHSPSYTDLSL